MKNIIIICIGLLVADIGFAQGNVGIGTTTPTAKLHVNGSIRIVNGTQGANKVLTSDASGVGTWQTIATPPPQSSNNSYGVNEVVWIGCNAWMTKNLDVDTFRNGDPIEYITNGTDWAQADSAAYCYYSNNPANGAKYGKLYNWYAVNDPRGLAPEGWHIPSEFEWTTLINTLGGVTVAGGPMKQIGITNWEIPNVGATNFCNFSAEPGGYRGIQGGFNLEGEYGHWWTSTMSEMGFAWSRNLNYADTEVGGASAQVNIGYSVRCIKD